MRRNQGGAIAAGYLYLAGAIALLAALAGAVHAWHSYTDSIDAKGYERGKKEATAEFEARDNAQLQAALAATKAAEKRAEDAEAEARRLQGIATDSYTKGVKDGKAKTEARIAANRAGTNELRDPGREAGSGATGPAGTATAQAPGSSGGGDGQAGAQLSRQAAEFLLQLTGEADDVARQLIAAQAVIVSDRALCNSP